MIVILLDNAIKYSSEETSVRVVSKLSKSFAQIQIIDNGIGVRSQDRERIFERFYRADTSRSSQNVTGHGLGLSIAKNISDIHDAGLRVERSDADEGTTFAFRLRRMN
jgi:signal transduction histidine kinase